MNMRFTSLGKRLALALVLALAGGLGWGAHGVATAQIRIPFLERRAPLQVRVVDGRTGEALAGAEVVVLETGQRMTTGADGTTPEILAPILRDPNLTRLIAEYHGQLTLIVYKNGYRDTVFFGVRMDEGRKAEPEVWMYQITPEDERIEPVEYHVPIHRIWLLQLAEQFRSTTQPGEGPESPDR